MDALVLWDIDHTLIENHGVDFEAGRYGSDDEGPRQSRRDRAKATS